MTSCFCMVRILLSNLVLLQCHEVVFGPRPVEVG